MTPYPTFESFRPKVLAENRLGAPAPANTLAGASALLVRAARPKGRPQQAVPNIHSLVSKSF